MVLEFEWIEGNLVRFISVVLTKPSFVFFFLGNQQCHADNEELFLTEINKMYADFLIDLEAYLIVGSHSAFCHDLLPEQRCHLASLEWRGVESCAVTGRLC